MQEKKLHIVHLGTSGFPYGLGAMQRIKLMCRGLQEAGVEVLVVNRKGRHPQTSGFDLKVEGQWEGVRYLCTSGVPHRPEGFWRRNWLKGVGLREEWRLLRQLKNRQQLDVLLLYLAGEFHYLLYYVLLARLLKVPVVLNYVEYRSAWSSREGWQRWNDWLFDRYAMQLADASLPISHFLVEKIKESAPGRPYLRVPVLCDFQQFQVLDPTEYHPYFLFAGAASYLDNIRWVCQAHGCLPVDAPPLRLVLGGSAVEIKHVRTYVDSLAGRDRIELFANVPHTEMPAQMASALALLLPLQDTVQDRARFPHKVGEYLASGKPLITTPVGEILFSLKDGTDALIASSFEPLDFAKKMAWAIRFPESARAIGQRGRATGLALFEYRSWGKRLYAFLARLCGKEAPQDIPLEESTNLIRS